MLLGSTRQGVCVLRAFSVSVGKDLLSGIAACVLCLLCKCCLLSKCLHPVPALSQEGIAFSAFAQTHSACVDLSDSSRKPRSSTSRRADLFLCNFSTGKAGQ